MVIVPDAGGGNPFAGWGYVGVYKGEFVVSFLGLGESVVLVIVYVECVEVGRLVAIDSVVEGLRRFVDDLVLEIFEGERGARPS